MKSIDNLPLYYVEISNKQLKFTISTMGNSANIGRDLESNRLISCGTYSWFSLEKSTTSQSSISS